MHARLRFITILLIEILAGAELDLFIPSFPELKSVFGLSPAGVQLTLSLNFVAYCVCTLFAGTLGDRYNRRYVMLSGLSIFVLGSIFCMLAPSFSWLVFGRFLQGVGIAAPAILAYVVIADEYPIAKQPALLGLLNGVVTIAMAFAPVIGSFINLYLGWRANFGLLLGLGGMVLVASYWVLPHRLGDKTISLSMRAYLPLLNSQKFVFYLVGICCLVMSYWIFIGMAPILYMENLKIPLAHFGYYQGALAAIFSIASLLSPKIYAKWGYEKPFKTGLFVCLASAGLILGVALLKVSSAFMITLVMLVFSIGIVFPINILYPFALEIVENTKSRAAAVIQAHRLVLTAVVLEVVSYFYTGDFLLMGVVMFFFISTGLLFCGWLLKRNWVFSNAQTLNTQ